MNCKGDLSKFGIMLILILGLNGCALFKPMVVIPIEKPSRYQWSDVKTLAILDFSGPFDYKFAGSILSNKARSMFINNGQYDIINGALLKSFINQHRLSANRFQELSTIRFVADHISTDAICFGDILVLKMTKKTKTSRKRVKAGQEQVEKLFIDSKGNTRVVIEYQPVYKDIKVNHLTRTVKLAIKARMIRTKNAAVLWEETIHFERPYYGSEDELSGRQGHWETDGQLLELSLERATRRLFRSLLKHKSKRERFLADSPSTDAYGKLIEQGNQFAQSGKWTMAGQVWLQAFNLDHERPQAIANLGVIREKNGEYRQAIKDYFYAGSKLGQPWTSYGQDVMNYRRNKISDTDKTNH